MKVLHVDGDAGRAGVAAALAADVEAVADAAGARAALRDGAFDCVVTELALDDADGLAFVAEVDSAYPDLPVVVYTDSGSESLAGDAVAAGADAYVPKPDAEALAERVADLTGTAGTPRTTDPVVEQAQLAVVEWDHEFRAVSWNPAAEELFGYDRETALGKSARELVVPSSARDRADEIWSALSTGQGGRLAVNENVRADGSTVTCQWHNVPRYDADGEMVGVVSFVRDVTDRERRSRVMSSLQEATRGMIRMGSRAEIAEAAVDAARDVLGHPLSAVRLYDEDSGALELAALTDAGEALLPMPFEEAPAIGPGDDAVWRAFEAGEARVFDPISSEDSTYGSDRPVESLVVLPLGEQGVLTLGATETDAFDDEDRRLGDVLAATVEAAMDRAGRERELERYRAIVTAAGDAVFALDEDGYFQQVNDRVLEMTGYDRAEMLGEHAEAFVDDADLERARTQIARLANREAEVVTYELAFRSRDGERVPVEVSQSRLPGERFQGTVGTARDVTERKRMEAALRERERKITALHDVASALDDCDTESEVGAVAVDAARKVLDFDECTLREQVADGFALLASTTDEAPEFREGSVTYQSTLAAGESRVIDDLRERDLDVTNPWGFRSMLAVPVGDRAVMQAVSTSPGDFDADDVELAELLGSHVADALDRLAAEAQLRTERDRFAALFDNVPDPVVATTHTDDGPIVTAVNPAFEETFGYDGEDLVGSNLDDRIVPADDRAAAQRFNAEALAGDVVETEARRLTADGFRDFRLTVVPVELGEESPATFGVYTDVTERKQRRKRVEVLNRVLRHDLRNGMNIVRGEAELLADELAAGDADHARTILDRADELLRLAERTRAVERSLDRDTSTAGPVDLAAVVHRTAAELRERFPEAELTVDAPDSAVVVGEKLLEIAVFDAVENAVVHNDQPTPRVEVTVERVDGDVRVRVADDGPGIPEAERRLLTGDEEISQLHHGSGLGLWLVNWAVTHSGGELLFSDNDPRGSVVTMRLPASDDQRRTQAIDE